MELRELAVRQQAWVESAPAGQRDLDQSVFSARRLTGADVFWLAAYTLAGPLGDLDEAGAHLRAAAADAYVHFFSLPSLHLEGASLTQAQFAGAFLIGAQLQRADLASTDLRGVNLSTAQLLGAKLTGAQLREADLGWAKLQGADLEGAHLQGANLSHSNLQGANLYGAHLQGANLGSAQVQGANFTDAHLRNVDLTRATFDRTSHLNEAILTGASFDQAAFDTTNLTVVDWSRVDQLGDERTARASIDGEGRPKSGQRRLDEFQAAARANRALAVALQAQGLREDASRFAYRAQVLQRQVLRRKRELGAYLFSLVLAALAGYGYRLWRILAVYVATLAVFALVYAVLGVHSFRGESGVQAFWDAFLVSLSAIHGRTTFEQLGAWTPAAWTAAIESVVGIVIEGVLVATLVQRFFGR
jgi:uncharacterized protein YjbI with pentapeptide repeats